MIKFNEPLGQPQGTVRAAITLILLISTIALHVMGKPDSFIDSLTALAVGFYIGQRTGENVDTKRSDSEVLMDTSKLNTGDDEPDQTGFVPGEE